MSFLNRNYDPQTDPDTGLAVIVETGRCTADERAAIEANCTRRFEMVKLPQAAGAILKALDGTIPRLVDVEPSTLTGARFRCVKVDGRCRPLAPAQTVGTYSGKTILRYLIRWQEVGGVA